MVASVRSFAELTDTARVFGLEFLESRGAGSDGAARRRAVWCRTRISVTNTSQRPSEGVSEGVSEKVKRLLQLLCVLQYAVGR